MPKILIDVPEGEYCEGCVYNMYHGPDRRCRLLFQDRETREKSPGAWYHLKCHPCLDAIEKHEMMMNGISQMSYHKGYDDAIAKASKKG